MIFILWHHTNLLENLWCQLGDFSFVKALIVLRDMKVNILDKLAETMYSYKAYPKDPEIEKVARALVEKHPCLKAPGSDTGS